MSRIWLILPAFLAACGAMEPLHALSATPEGVTFEYRSDRQPEAARRATLYCANLGRQAVLRDVRREIDDLSVAVFDCR